MELLLKDNTTYTLSDEDYIFFQNHYPTVDIDSELRTMQAWCYSNPSKRKTRRGAKSFINAWLCRTSKRKPLERGTVRSRDTTIEQDLLNRDWAL